MKALEGAEGLAVKSDSLATPDRQGMLYQPCPKAGGTLSDWALSQCILIAFGKQEQLWEHWVN